MHLLREYDTVARADNYFAEYRMLFLRRHSNERDIFRGSCIDVIKSRLRKYLKAPASSRIMPFLKEGEIRRRKKCSEHLKELNRNVGETEVDQTDADQTDTSPGTDYKDICWQDGRRIVELKTLAEQSCIVFLIMINSICVLTFLCHLDKPTTFGLKCIDVKS